MRDWSETAFEENTTKPSRWRLPGSPGDPDPRLARLSGQSSCPRGVNFSEMWRVQRLDQINAKKPAKLLNSKSLTLDFSRQQIWPVFLCSRQLDPEQPNFLLARLDRFLGGRQRQPQGSRGRRGRGLDASRRRRSGKAHQGNKPVGRNRLDPGFYLEAYRGARKYPLTNAAPRCLKLLGMPEGGSGNKIGCGLAAASSAAVFAVFLAGNVRTQSAVRQFAREVGERRVAGMVHRRVRSVQEGLHWESSGVPASPSPARSGAPATPKEHWKDGMYTGWGFSPHGNIEAEVRIEGGRIVSAIIFAVSDAVFVRRDRIAARTGGDATKPGCGLRFERDAGCGRFL